MIYRTVNFYEADYSIRSIQCEEDRLKAFRLRHQIFNEMLEWVPPSPSRLEIDRYDQSAKTVGLFSESGKIAGLVRLVTSDQPYMLETEFADLLVPGHNLRKEDDTIEISRLAVVPSEKKGGPSPGHLHMILKGLYQWCLANEIRYAYMEVEKRFCRTLRILGFPCEPIGPIKKLPPAGAESVAAFLDWEAFRSQNRIKRPVFLDWITTVQSTPAPLLEQWRVPGSTPGVLKEYSEHEISQSAR
jgi:N-acyl-L-homoserine lactone synthetase